MSKIRYIGYSISSFLWIIITLPFLLDYRYLIGRRKMLEYFLQKVSQDPIGERLLKEAEKENINFVVRPIKIIGMANEQIRNERVIWITSKLLREFFNNKVDIKHIWFCIVHENGHLENITLLEKILKKCKYARYFSIKGCFATCLYVELLASQKGLQSLEKISGKNIKEIFPEGYVDRLLTPLFFRCQKYCIEKGILKNRCPKMKELNEMGIEIIQKGKDEWEYKISFIPCDSHAINR